VRRIAIVLALAALELPCKRKPPPAPAPTDAYVPKLSFGDLGKICTGGGGDARAPAYVKTPGKPSPAAIFVNDSRETRGGFSQASMFESEILTGGIKPDDAGWDTRSAEEVQLVLCGEIVSTEKNGLHCTYQERKTNESKVLDFASMQVTYKVYEAKTGKQLAEGAKLDVPPPHGCPFSHHFYGRGAREVYVRDPAVVWTRALAPLQPPDAKLPTVDFDDTWIACDGHGVPGAPAYSKTKGSTNKFRAASKPVDKAFYDTVLEIFDDQHGADKEMPAVVVCKSHTRGKKIKDCKYTGDKKLALYRATWTYRMVDAQTGAVLGEKTLKESKSDYCPSTWDFDRDGTDTDAEPVSDANKFVLPFLLPK
jgi:hypothetical protein